jgi:DnaK suppressor protein
LTFDMEFEMAAKKPAKAKKPAAKKPEPKKAAKPAPKAKPVAAKAKPKAKAPAPAAKAKSAPAPKPSKAPVKAAPPAKAAPKAPAKPTPAPKAAPPPKAAKAPKPADVVLKPAPRLPTPPESDDDSPETSLSLLAGPRNVKPYLAKKGEQYMGAQQLEHFRKILSTWKNDLMVEVDRTVTHMKDEAANPPDPNDRATLESEFSLELRTRDRERKLIRKIDEALARIEDGSYGYCLETGEEIGIKRLEARPVATLSIEAQERRERREKQYGDRDDRYR